MDNLDRKNMYQLVVDCVGIDLKEGNADHILSTNEIKMLLEEVCKLEDQLCWARFSRSSKVEFVDGGIFFRPISNFPEEHD